MPVVGNEIIDPLYYERYGYPHASWEFLRRHQPVAWMEPPGMKPFWAVTRYADVSAISRDAKRWKIAPRIAVFPEVQFNTENPAFRHLLSMDPPEHGKYRNLLSLRFTPKTLEPKREVVGRIVDEALARLAARREADFVEDFAATIPLAVIAEMIGLPRQDWRLMFGLSNAIIASEDTEVQKGADTRRTSQRARDGGVHGCPDRRVGAAVILRAAPRRGQRDHAQRDVGRPAGPAGAPRPARAAARRILARPQGGRGERPLGGR